MEDATVGHRRRSSVKAAHIRTGGGSRRGSRQDETTGPSHRRRRDNVGNGEPKHGADDVHDSDLSSPSTSEDVELEDMPSDDGLEDDEETGLTKLDRSRRRRRKRRNSRMDARVVREATVPGIELSAADQSVLKRSLINVALIGCWYFFSVSISLYNKWMFSPDHLNFRFPLFTTCLHMLVQFSLANVVLYFFPRFRPRHDSITHPNDSNTRIDRATESEKPLMTRKFYLTRIGPCGAATGLDIGLGNMSLRFITLTFYTMCKSSALGFVLLFAFLFRLEKPSIKLVVIILTMTIGVIMMVAGETAFNALGFVLVISSAFFSGFRWALTQILLLRNPATSNPFSSIFYLAPVMFLSLLVIALPVEGVPSLAERLSELYAAKGIFFSTGILLFPGALAFLMTSSEFALLQRTSVVTLSICGIFKEVVTISGAGIVYHDDLTVINLSGLIVTIACIAAYNYLKIKKMRSEAKAAEANPSPPPSPVAVGTFPGIRTDYQPVLHTAQEEDEPDGEPSPTTDFRGSRSYDQCERDPAPGAVGDGAAKGRNSAIGSRSNLATGSPVPGKGGEIAGAGSGSGSGSAISPTQ